MITIINWKVSRVAVKKMKTIDEMHVGEKAMIKAIKHQKAMLNRLLDLGIAPNVEVTLLRKLNFDKLFIIDVDDVEVCIRLNDAKLITVEG